MASDKPILAGEVSDPLLKTEIEIMYDRKADNFYARLDGERIVGVNRREVEAELATRIKARSALVYLPTIKIDATHRNEVTDAPAIFRATRCELAKHGQDWWGRDWGQQGFGRLINYEGTNRSGAKVRAPEALPFTVTHYNSTTVYLPYDQAMWRQIEEVTQGALAFQRAQLRTMRGLAGLTLGATPGTLPALAGIGLALAISLKALPAPVEDADDDE